MEKNKVPRILVVDDEATIRTVIRRWLEQAGYEVSDASNGQQAMAMFSNCASDLIICDMFMAEMDGIEMIQKLKRVDPKVKVLAISGGGSLGHLEMLEVGKLLGANETLSKPFDMSKLLMSVQQMLA